MYWCKYHGILTPASLTWLKESWEPGTGYFDKVCGYDTGSGACIAKVYDLDKEEIDTIGDMAPGMIKGRARRQDTKQNKCGLCGNPVNPPWKYCDDCQERHGT